MKAKSKFKIVVVFYIFLVGLTVFIISKSPLRVIDYFDIAEKEKDLFSLKTANNDTSSPIISFIQPDNNDTVITRKYYDVMVNITDDNSPLPGTVSIEISNATVSFFNSSMEKIDQDRWLFRWNNITSYPNEKTYFFQVTAKDSSSNENIGISGRLSVYVDVYTSREPGFINGIIYVLVVSFLIAGIMVYFNRKRNMFSSKKD
jgi:hypothetical protein